MDSPLISVIVPTKDRPDLLRRALESIAAQEFDRGIEAIVVDDASAESQEWVRGFAADIGLELVFVHHEFSRDLAGARNAGLRVARGRYVGYLDDDDVWLPQHARLLVAALEANPTTRAAFSLAERWGQERRDGAWVTVERTIEHQHAELVLHLIVLTNLTPVNTVLHERSLVDEIGGFDESLTVLEDWDMWIRMRTVTDFAHVPEVTCAFTTRIGDNMTAARRLEFWPTQARIYARHRAIADRFPRITDVQERTMAELLAGHPPDVQVQLQERAIDLVQQSPRDRSLRELHPFEVTYVIPVRDDAEATLATLTELSEQAADEVAEFVLVDDGADAASRHLLEALSGDVRIVRHDQTLGDDASYVSGSDVARGERIVRVPLARQLA